MPLLAIDFREHMCTGFDSYLEFLWIVLGVVMIVLEMILVSGIGFLFAGLGAITTALLLAFDLISQELGVSLAVFLISVVAWWLLLWYPIKLSRRTREPYQDLVGTIVVLNHELRKGQVGSVVWSGVTMRAALDKEEQASSLKKGQRAQITRIKGNILYLKQEV
jgi:membrane protein implicated in regulation of membrane protease activity